MRFRWTRVYLAVVAGLCAVVASHPVASAEPAKVSIADRVGPSLVFISTEYKGRVEIPFTSGATWTDELTLKSSCTGYIVDPTGYIATAGHCVNAADPEIADAFRQEAVVAVAKAQNRDLNWARDTYAIAKNNQWPVRGDAQSSNQPDRSVSIKQPAGPHRTFDDWTTAQVIDYQQFKDGDNAVLKVNNTSGPLPALVISAVVPAPGDPVTSIGFPAAVQGTNDTSTIAQPSYKTGTVSSRQTGDSGIARTEVSAEMGKGMSGGPTVDANALVVGTNSSGSSLADDNATFNFITDNIALRSYLQSHGVTLQAAPVEKSSSNLWLWLGPLIGVLVAMLAGLVVFLLRRGTKKTPAVPFGPPGYAGPGPQFGPAQFPRPGGPPPPRRPGPPPQTTMMPAPPPTRRAPNPPQPHYQQRSPQPAPPRQPPPSRQFSQHNPYPPNPNRPVPGPPPGGPLR
ncbi:serine protease [Gordonia sp. CPCC 205515]|uniref:trypsin-like peptidase domain-containing protein n=1 Tax=Gordonia sp. CPCC 205515 TaxID=3140791 RepID=UPI003AF3F17D